MDTKKIYELHYLSSEFYKKYNSSDYPEIEHKAQRPYIVLLIKVDNNTFALPLRTNIKHSSCYKFQYYQDQQIVLRALILQKLL